MATALLVLAVLTGDTRAEVVSLRAQTLLERTAIGCSEDLALAERFVAFRRRVGREHEVVTCKHVQTFSDNLRHVEALRAEMRAMAKESSDEEDDGLDTAEYSVDHSPFGDMTPQEFQEKVLMTEIDTSHLGSVSQASLQEATEASDMVFDWNEKGAVSAVRSQGSIGTCYAFAAAGAVEGQLAIHQGVQGAVVSVEHVIECDEGQEETSERTIADCGEFGGWPHLVFSFWKNQGGFVAEDIFPYCAGELDAKTLMPKCFPCMARGYSKNGCGDHGDLYCNASSTQGQGTHRPICKDRGWVRANRLGVPSSWTRLSTDVGEQTAQIAKTGPATALMDATMLQFYRRGVANPWLCSKSVKNHAVLITGHGPGWFRVKNSWGPKFGEDGFFRIREAKCGINDLVYSVALAGDQNVQ
ncbi:Cysteine proteinase 1 [Hondaea fermentalgiana]|uniref:Cysteine proteinase 1 n=1 Tax=Hondaea fermentalgiana TaxID=2315210 RepID=A0A2R5GTR4_9STRA|nr:Cysteine proteinase 1 [Hondaea fermentalgiana]|eukprot:GBG34267.1 Cysteine proteinase 1 [Hondaea fermentalgiana]